MSLYSREGRCEAFGIENYDDEIELPKKVCQKHGNYTGRCPFCFFSVGDVVTCVKQKQYFALIHCVGSIHKVDEKNVEIMNRNAECYKLCKPKVGKRHVYAHTLRSDGMTLGVFREQTKDDPDDSLIAIEEEDGFGQQIVIYRVEDEPIDAYIARQNLEDAAEYEEYLRLKQKFGGESENQ